MCVNMFIVGKHVIHSWCQFLFLQKPSVAGESVHEVSSTKTQALNRAHVPWFCMHTYCTTNILYTQHMPWQNSVVTQHVWWHYRVPACTLCTTSTIDPFRLSLKLGTSLHWPRWPARGTWGLSMMGGLMVTGSWEKKRVCVLERQSVTWCHCVFSWGNLSDEIATCNVMACGKPVYVSMVSLSHCGSLLLCSCVMLWIMACCPRGEMLSA